MTRFAAAALLVVLALVGAPARAGATVVDEAAESLRSNFVYVDPSAERAINPDEAEDVRAAIGSARTPIYVAVLPDSARDAAGGDASAVADQLANAVDRSGTYAVVVGNSFRAGSDVLPDAAALADEAFDAGDSTIGVLTEFIRLVGEQVASGGGEGSGGAGSNDGGGTNWVLWGLLIVAVVVGAILLWRLRQRRKAAAAERARQEAADRQLLAAELSVLADDVVRLEPDVQLQPSAQGDFDAAVNRYRAAQAALDAADEPVDLVRVERVVVEARYSMDRAKAIMEGRQPPEPPTVLRQVGPHGEPAVTLDQGRQPTYVGYPGAFQDGWFGGTGSALFGGLLLGSMLGWGFGGWGYGATTVGGESGGDGGGGGDWGGGDWGGGGDFGGGDFGGGDFGGGDFGG